MGVIEDEDEDEDKVPGVDRANIFGVTNVPTLRNEPLYAPIIHISALDPAHFENIVEFVVAVA